MCGKSSKFQVIGIRAYKKRAAKKAAEAEQQKAAQLEAHGPLPQEKQITEHTQQSDTKLVPEVPSSMISNAEIPLSLRDDGDGTYMMKESKLDMPNSLEDFY